jgi:hypothetical protein
MDGFSASGGSMADSEGGDFSNHWGGSTSSGCIKKLVRVSLKE